MKRTFRSMMALAIAVVTLAAYSSSDDASKYVADVTLPTGTENTEDADILVEAGANEFTLDIKTEGQWTVTSQNRFLHVKNGSGTGNATVTSWTWERLIQDGKAALAVDTDATPQRIVSTDKKALKAGGLVLALAGAIVAPTDEVDSTREYELVAM